LKARLSAGGGGLVALLLVVRAAGASAAVPIAAVDSERRTALVVSMQLLAPPGTDLTGLQELLAQPLGEPLSPALVRRSVQRLYQTGRFRLVRVYARTVGEGQTVFFELVPIVRVAEVVFRGNHVLSDAELHRLFGVAPRDELVEQRLPAALAVLQRGYARRGYPDARLDVQLSLTATQAVVTVDIEEGKPLKLRRVEITGQLGVPAWMVSERLGLSPGMVADHERLDAAMADLAKLYRDKSYYGAQPPTYVLEPAGPGLVDARIDIEAGKPFQIRFAGNVTFTGKELRPVLDYDGDEVLDEQLAARLADRLREFYLRQGFLDARVRAILQSDRGLMVLLFRIDQGWPLTVSRITLQGATSLNPPALLAAFEEDVRQEQPQPFFALPDSAEVDELGVSGRPQSPTEPRYVPDPNLYIPEAFSRAIQHVEEYYRDEGFLSVEVTGPILDIDLRRRKVAVQVDVSEGPRTLVSHLALEGMPPQAAKPVLLVAEGQPLSRSRLDASRKSVLRELDRAGYPFAKVEILEQLGEDHRSATVTLRVIDGPRVRLGQVVIQGAHRTQPWLILDNLALHSGELYRPEEFHETQVNLASLAIFDSVQVSFLDPTVSEPVKDVLVVVHERPPQSIVVGGGYSLVEGPRAYVEYTHWNLFGLGLRFQTELRINYYPLSYLALSEPSGNLVAEGLPPATALTGKDNFYGFGGRLSATLTYPRAFKLFGGDGTLRLEGLIQRVDRPYYAFSKAAIVPGASLRLDRHWTVALQYDLEWDQISTYWANLDEVYSKLNFGDLQNLRFPPGQGVLGGLGPSVVYDRRDDPINPHSGWAATLKGKWVVGVFHPSAPDNGSVFGGSAASTAPLPVNLISVSASVVAYIPIGPSLNVALSVKGGRIFPIDNTFVIPTQRFFLGGADTDRGFQLDTMLPQDVRTALDSIDVPVCRQTATAASCSTAARLLRGGNQLPSPGGQVYDDFRVELRFPVYGKSLNGAVFLDAGNLWSIPTFFNLFVLRPAAGAGIRLNSPVGPVAFDVGFNLAPDYLVNESVVQFFLTVGVL
jgi:outer membrane protein insertion porin family